MGLWICSLVCHRYLRDVLLTFSYLCILQGKTKSVYRVDTLTPSTWISPLVPTMILASGDVQTSQFLPAQHFLMKSILFLWLHGTDKDQTLWCDWWGGGEEIILMVIQGSWDSKEEKKKALTDLA